MSLYRDLLKRIDQLSYGFPKSFIGADLLLIKKIFAEEDARDYLLMGKTDEDGKFKPRYETAHEYAERNGFTDEEAKEKLDRMAMRGLIFRRHREHGDEYGQFPFVMGFLEWQGKRTGEKSWLWYTMLYMMFSRWGKRMTQTMPFYRTIPQRPQMVQGSVIKPYDNIEALLDKHTRFAVGQCICRTMDRAIPGNKCNHPTETCIETDDYATFFIETGIGREITKEEALQILRDGEKDGRIIQATNSQDGENFCSCCGCGCGMLNMRKLFPGPANNIWSNHYCEINYDKCIGCGKCVSRCPFGYIKQEKKATWTNANGKLVKKVTIDQNACLGCGLCVSTCPPKAMCLRQKPEDKLYTPPETYDDAMEIWEAETKKDYNKFK